MSWRSLGLVLVAGFVAAERITAPAGAAAPRPTMREAAADLERAMRAPPAVRRVQGERLFEEALFQANIAAAGCTKEPEVCRDSVQSVLRVCSAITCGRYSAELREQVLATLGWVAIGGCVHHEDVHHVASACDHALRRGDVSHHYILHALEAMVQNYILDTSVARGIVRIAAGLVEGAGLPEEEEEKAVFVSEAMAFLSRVVHVATRHATSITHVIRAVKDVVELAQVARGAQWAGAAAAAVSTLDSVLRLTAGGEVVDAAFAVAEVCADGSRGQAAVAVTGELASALAEKAEAAQFGRIARLCARPAVTPEAGARRATAAVARRLLEKGAAEEGCEVLADIMALLEEMGSVLPCDGATRFLGRARALDTPGRALLGAAVRPPLPLELVMQVEDMAPPLPEERARLRIVSICARSAGNDTSHAPAVLRGACALPRRVGRTAARRFVRLHCGRGAGDAALDGAFADVGICLAGAGRGDERLWDLDVAGMERVVLELLAGCASTFEAWKPERRRIIIEPLRALLGGEPPRAGTF